MKKEMVIKNTQDYVKSLCYGETTGHDWWHVLRVRNTAIKIAEIENADLEIVELSALLHDVDDWKFKEKSEANEGIAEKWLKKNKIPAKKIELILEIIECVSFKGSGVETPMRTIEGKIVQDADRLDAMGAVGIARTFAYGGSRKRELYNPEEKPEIHSSFEDYKKSKSHTINHFYEKLLLLKDRMNTETAKKMAESRHSFMLEYLNRFLEEWEGRD
ncbi:MAG: HD domain-containing protein [Bacteroidales bacterium]|nr:HD domain-containing protein [Bacteroidales bacterium]